MKCQIVQEPFISIKQNTFSFLGDINNIFMCILHDRVFILTYIVFWEHLVACLQVSQHTVGLFVYILYSTFGVNSRSRTRVYDRVSLSNDNAAWTLYILLQVAYIDSLFTRFRFS